MLALPDVVFHLPSWCCGHFAEVLAAASPRGFSAYVHGAEVFFVVGQPGERTTLLANVGFELTLGSVSLPEGQARACPVRLSSRSRPVKDSQMNTSRRLQPGRTPKASAPGNFLAELPCLGVCSPAVGACRTCRIQKERYGFYIHAHGRPAAVIRLVREPWPKSRALWCCCISD